MTMTMWYDMDQSWDPSDILTGKLLLRQHLCQNFDQFPFWYQWNSIFCNSLFDQSHLIYKTRDRFQKSDMLCLVFSSAFNSYLMIPCPQWWYPYPIKIFCNFLSAFHHIQSLGICAHILYVIGGIFNCQLIPPQYKFLYTPALKKKNVWSHITSNLLV